MFKTFGKKPFGANLKRIEESTFYRSGMFMNQAPTEQIREGVSMFTISKAFFNKPKHVEPVSVIPSVKTDLKNYTANEPRITWFGHSSYLIQSAGKNILVDPVFSGYASPFSFSVKAFKGSNVYTVDDLPEIDILLLTHDHYDHLDYKTVLKLKQKTKQVCTSLGVGSHLRFWGFNPENTIEFEWGQNWTSADGIELTAETARHFSGRSFTRAKTMWASYVLTINGYRLYIGADSGYGEHFKHIGEKHGPFDMVMLETGQYNDWWPQIHMKPEETAQAAVDLNAKILFPVHWGKFALAFHHWKEPVERVVKKAGELNVKLTTPMIGEPIILDKEYPSDPWWEVLK
ncbi:MAG TPA: MBL fold metallo-hydrolase [Bacteroidia bacterium]